MICGKDNLKQNGGFSLVEVLISIFILSILVASASAAFIYSTKTAGDHEIRMHALNIANETVENIRSMKFADIGTKFRTNGGVYIHGDPAGDILQEEIRHHNGIDYLVKVNISWEEEAEWDLSGNAEWDYKSVWVSVTPQGSRFQKLEQRIETYVTRDYSQPALKGSNIRIRCVRGWIFPGESKKVVQGINALLSSGPSAVRFVNTSTKGVASFIDLVPGDYEVKIDPGSQGYILHPKSLETLNFELENLTTKSEEIEIERPCSLKFILKDLSENMITPSRLDEGALGRISITAPHPAGTILQNNFTAGDIDSMGRLPENLYTGLWPVGSGYSGAYTLTDVSIDSLQFIGGYTKVGGTEEQWNGKFDNPGTMKEIILYFSVAPVTPVGITTNWVDETNTIPAGSYYAIDDGDPLEAAILTTTDLTDTLVIPEDGETDLNGLKLFFENKGTPASRGLLVKKNSILNLHGSEIIFRGGIGIEKVTYPNADGKIYLNTVWEDGRETSTIYGHDIDDKNVEADTLYGKLYLTEPLYIGENIAIDEGGYYFPNGTILPDESGRLIPFTKENYVD